MFIQIEVSYNMYGSHTIELPESKTWADVEDFWVKWDVAHILFKGEAEVRKYDLQSYEMESIDMKRPTSVEVYECDEEGNVDYENALVRDEE